MKILFCHASWSEKSSRVTVKPWEKKTGKFGILKPVQIQKIYSSYLEWVPCILYQKRCNKFYHFQTCTPAKFLNIDPGFLEWGFKLIKGVRFLHFTRFFFNFSMKLTYLIPEWGLFKTSVGQNPPRTESPPLFFVDEDRIPPSISCK